MDFFFFWYIFIDEYSCLRVVGLFHVLCLYLANINLVLGRYFLMQAGRMNAEPAQEVQKKIAK